MIYVLDEPTIGLHPRDTDRLLGTLEDLRDIGNTVIVVEHDRDTIARADHVVDMGPGAGTEGGRIVAVGTPDEIRAQEDSPTGTYLSGRARIEKPATRRTGTGGTLRLRGANLHNLAHLDLDIPTGTFVVVTGVSGSGKSTLVMETLRPALAQWLEEGGSGTRLGSGDECWAQLEVEQPTEGRRIRKLSVIDQTPLGRSPKSNAATYTGAMGSIRELFSKVPLARQRGYKPRRFSFNTGSGRCPACDGAGASLVEMHFLSDVWVTCDECRGHRYGPETLEIRFRGRNIADVLEMGIDEATLLFENQKRIHRILDTLRRVGLGYLSLGQSATTLSGGEAQRVKLASELARVQTGDTAYLLDEPTTGLHLADVDRLLAVLHDLTDAGNTVIAIEHHPDVILAADLVVDLGPEAADDGGRIVAIGTPEEVAASGSHTGLALQRLLEAGP